MDVNWCVYEVRWGAAWMFFYYYYYYYSFHWCGNVVELSSYIRPFNGCIAITTTLHRILLIFLSSCGNNGISQYEYVCMLSIEIGKEKKLIHSISSASLIPVIMVAVMVIMMVVVMVVVMVVLVHNGHILFLAVVHLKFKCHELNVNYVDFRFYWYRLRMDYGLTGLWTCTGVWCSISTGRGWISATLTYRWQQVIDALIEYNQYY